jgi:hypothetical protein
MNPSINVPEYLRGNLPGKEVSCIGVALPLAILEMLSRFATRFHGDVPIRCPSHY